MKYIFLMFRKLLQVWMSEDMHKRIRAYCAEINISISEFIRRLVEEHFNG